MAWMRTGLNRPFTSANFPRGQIDKCHISWIKLHCIWIAIIPLVISLNYLLYLV